MPTTLLVGSPQAFCSAHTMASSGLVTTITKALGAYCLMPSPGLLHHLEVDAEQVVTAHAGLSRHAGGDDDHVGAGDVGVGVGGLEAHVEALDGTGLAEVEALAARHALDDVEQHHVAQLLEPDEVGQRAADHACADQRNLGARHSLLLLWCAALPESIEPTHGCQGQDPSLQKGSGPSPLPLS